ncbi:MAG: FAD-binding oxidoreductase [Gammaproteobacteria bacterium]|nr:FAD-binding oxidoreductase [Gammaproteobacteria bacterium]
MHERADILVIGAGIAGSSAAAELAADASVILLEGESHPGYHATGRSAAFFAPAYGNSVVRGLTGVSEPFFRHPPPDFSETALLRPRDCLFIARPEQLPQLQSLQEENSALQWFSGEAAVQAQPLLSADYVAAALRDGHGGDLDVDAILQGYLRLLRRRGGRLLAREQVTALQRVAGCWQVQTERSSYRAPVVVNAAGAWVDSIAMLAGLAGVGISPMRRTAVLIDVPAGHDCSDWPMVVDVDEEFYFKPDAGQLLISPADETPSPACDAQPEELDVALAVDRFERATGVEVSRVNHRWAGLRSFAPDQTFVVGFDPRVPGFFWLAGQGGYGVQSAPAMAQLAASLITASAPASPFAGVMAYKEAVAPERLLD